jgi:hypothetical protein
MPTIAAVAACLILVALAAFQVSLLAGAPLGRFAWGGQSDVLPTEKRRNAILAIVIYAFGILIVLQAVGAIAVFSTLIGQIAAYGLTVFFFVSFVRAAMSLSRSEQILMSIVNIVLAALSLFVAIAGHVDA